MSIEIKKYEITILGDSYTVVSDQNKEHVQLIACKVDEIIKEISQKSPHLEPRKAAVLAALRIASMLLNVEHDLKNVKSKSQALLNKLDEELASFFV